MRTLSQNPTDKKPSYKKHRKSLITMVALTVTGCSPATDTVQKNSPPILKQKVTADDAVNALNGVFGRHAKERSSHAKGLCIAGNFVPSNEARTFTDAPFFKNNRIPVIGRFSIGGGNPQASDKGRSVRGMGIRLETDDDILDLVMISAPTFFASTPHQFVEFLKVRTADKETGQKHPDKIAAFNAANPNIMPHLNYLANTSPPASYATTPYFTTHAFMFSNGDAKSRGARWEFQPVDGIRGLTAEQEENYPTDFLKDELAKRLDKSKAQWDVFLQIAQPRDNLVDPTAEWTQGRQHHLKVGRLTIEQILSDEEAVACKATVFDPNNLPEGIEPTDDPILALRGPAYSVSFSRRNE